MRGYFLFWFSVLGLSFFSVLLFSASNLFSFWLFLELCVLCLVPMFFLGGEVLSLSGLFSYLIVSSISSSLVVSGILFEGFLFLFLVGLLIKFGIFPFMGWVYEVVGGSNWCVVWGLSTFLKIPFFILPFLVLSVSVQLVEVFVIFSFLVLSGLFWIYTSDWLGCWCHMMLSSSACLISMAFYQSLEALFWFFVLYSLWSSFSIFFMSRQSGFYLIGIGAYFLFSFLLVSFPFSFSVFYKFLLSGYMYSCCFALFVSWVLYSISEQFYLLSILMGSEVPSSRLGVSCFV
nr:NADH dehydrogenase subunit 2 [Glypthelmins quieta]